MECGELTNGKTHRKLRAFATHRGHICLRKCSETVKQSTILCCPSRTILCRHVLEIKPTDKDVSVAVAELVEPRRAPLMMGSVCLELFCRGEFFNSVYHRFLLSAKSEMRCLCLKAMAVTYGRHHITIGSFPDSKYVVNMLAKCTNAAERDHLILLLSKLALNKENVRELICAGALPLLVDLAVLAHLHHLPCWRIVDARFNVRYRWLAQALPISPCPLLPTSNLTYWRQATMERTMALPNGTIQIKMGSDRDPSLSAGVAHLSMRVKVVVKAFIGDIGRMRLGYTEVRVA
uniref:Uncharacterized protein n=1 Tax=Parascaris equorum TaxID=6256 RepID=A0A914S2J8_PAREQ